MEYDYKNIVRNETPEMCKECGGQCCKRQPCILFPHDVFGEETPSVSKLVEFLSDDLYQIDWWEGDVDENDELDQIYFIRPREKLSNTGGIFIHSNMLYDPMWWGECYLLGPNGCTLDWNHRPSGGKCLVCTAPNTPDKNSPNAKLDAAKAWRPLQWLFKYIEDRVLK